VTKVTIRVGPIVPLLMCVLCGTSNIWGVNASDPAGTPVTAEALYAQLRSVGLDKSRVYRIREAALDRPGLHISLENGTVAFTGDIFGRITGVFFEGEGEVLLSPPNHAERASMALFTGMAILEEQFQTAYFRFNDDVFTELKPALRPTDNAQEFVAHWDDTARRLSELDALRLLITFSRFLPSADKNTEPDPGQHEGDRMLHARVQGRKLGTFDLLFDATAPESVWAGQTRKAEEGGAYYDLWTSFPVKQLSSRAEALQDAVAISRYRIRADIRPPDGLSGDARMQLKVKNGGQRTLLFELSRFLSVQSVEVNGRSVEFIHNQALEGTQLEKRGNDLVAVVFPSLLKTGEEMELHFVYSGDVLSEAGRGLLYVGARGTWYPNRGLSMANFDLEFHYPPEWTLLATGKKVPVAAGSVSSAANNSLTEAAAETTAHWVSERPIPVAGFNLGKYARGIAHSGGVTVESYATAVVERSFPKGTTEVMPLPDIRRPLPPTAPPITVAAPPPSPARNAQTVADRSARAIEFFARRFGPFPYSSLALTQMPGKISQGWPGLIFLSSYAFLTPVERKELHMSRQDALLDAQVLVHETAHQWWGDLVGWASYRDQWVMEALANYSCMMMLESENPTEFHELMRKFRDDLQQKNAEGQRLKDAGPVTFGPRLISSHFPNGYDAISYGRGTWLLHMLREMLRDSAPKVGSHSERSARGDDELFIRDLRKLRERYEGKIISTRDLLHVFEQDLPASLRFDGRKSLDWFLDSWINGTSIPHFGSQNVRYTEKDGSTVVTGTLLQEDAPDDLVTPVPIYAAVSGRSPLLLGRVFADGRETPFRLSAPSGTRKILIDPHQTLLSNP
jgi:peptidase M1-like protein